MDSLTVAFLALLMAATIAAAALDSSTPVPIIKSNEDGPNPDGSYSWSYETGNGIKAEERGELKKSQTENEDAISVQGSFSYTAEDGTPISLTYTADENGFQPKGDHLPTGPEIPPGILKALEWIAAHPEEDKLRK